MSNDIKTIVLDHGSGTVKVGFAGEETPNLIFPSIVGRPRFIRGLLGCGEKDQYISDEILEYSSVLNSKYPIKRGIVINWDDVDKIWDYTFKKKLKVDSSEHSILLTEAPMNPKANRELMIERMFETFNVPSFYVAIQGVLSLYASGRTTGIVFEVGEGVTQIVPIYKSKLITQSIKRFNIGGRDQTKYLRDILRERGYFFTTSEEFEIVRDIKEKLGYIPVDLDDELTKSRSTNECDANYTLPDDNIIHISNERFRCAEVLFHPNYIGYELASIPKYIKKSISKCDVCMRKDLYNNIILSGGSTMFKGFPERVYSEIIYWNPPDVNVKIIADPKRNIFTWRGGSILASNDKYPEMVITRDEYNDAGPGIVHRKCL